VYASKDSAPVEVTVTPGAGYSGTVTLVCAGIFPGESCTFTPPTLDLTNNTPAKSTLVVSTPPAEPGIHEDGGGPIQVVISDGQITQRPTFTLLVSSLNAGIGSDVIAAVGGTGTANLDLYGIPPFDITCSGLPSGASCSATGTQYSFPSDTFLVLNVDVATSVAFGNYPFTVNVSSGGISTTVPANLVVTSVPDFSVDTSSALWVLPATTIPKSLNLQATSSLTGVITFTCATDWGGDCMGNTVSPNSGTLTLYVTGPSQVTAGQHTITVTGTDGAVTHTYNIVAYIADYQGSASSATVSVSQGGQATANLSLSADNGFIDDVSLSCSSSPVTCSFNPSTVHLVGGTPASAVLTLTVPVSADRRPVPHPGRWRLAMVAFGMPLAGLLSLKCRTRNAIWQVIQGIAIVAIVAFVACGGGGGNGGGGSPPPSNGHATYSITVTASAAATSSTRTVGTITVTVN
jgi:hypothetical protein